MSKRPRMPSLARGLRGVRTALLALLIVGCGGSDGAWVWCQGNEDAVVDASSRLGLNKTLTHTWGCAHLSQDVDELHIWRACLAKDAAFIKVCRAVAQAAGAPAATGESLSDAEAAFCHSGEAQPVLESQAFSMGLVVSAIERPGTPPWRLRGVSGDALRSDAEYAKACNAAFEAAGPG